MQASEIQERHQLSFWDALIVATAVQGGAGLLLSEDLNAGQRIEGVRVVDPFNDAGQVLQRLLDDPESPDI